MLLLENIRKISDSNINLLLKNRGTIHYFYRLYISLMTINKNMINIVRIIKSAIVIYVFPTPLFVPNQVSSLFINSPVTIRETITPTNTKPIVDGLTFMSISPIIKTPFLD